jgi:PAS domain S-box-containing protein
VVLAVCLGVTLSAWSASRRNRTELDRARFQRFIDRTERGLQTRLGRYEDIARGAQGLFNLTHGTVSAEDWGDYVSRLDLPGRHPGLASLAFIRWVPSAGLEAYFQSHPQLRGRYHRPTADPHPLREPGQDGDHRIIELCEPGSRSTAALGLDVGTSWSQRLAMERAREIGGSALSGLIYFSLPTGRQDAVALYLPVLARQGRGAEETRGPVGWISAGILLRPLLEDLLRGEDQGMAFEIVDAQMAQGTQWLVASPDWPTGAPPEWVQTLDAGGRTWQLRYARKPSFARTGTQSAEHLILLGGLLISVSLAGIVWTLTGTRARAVGLAQRMNASLFEALQRNQDHLASTPLAAIETDECFRIREWNPAAERIFGYTRAEALGKDPRMLIPPEGQAEVDHRRAEIIQGRGGRRVTLENITRTGQRLMCDWYNTALKDGGGRFLGFFYLADDTTERRRAETALRQAQKLESLGVLAGGIAHDFNNLLTAILGNTEVALQRARDRADLLLPLQRIETTTQRGSDLARQLLAYAGKAHFAVRPLDLNTLILEMDNLLSISLSKKVALHHDFEPSLPPVEADSAQFQQVVMNLVINASEAIGDQPGNVTLRTRAVTYTQAQLSANFPGQVLEPGLYVRLEVADDGCGMDAETIGRIFDPFFTTKFTGRGLGLSAMLGIVRGHRAGLRVQSIPGEGTTFILVFPAGEATVVLPPPIPTVEEPIGGTILVVDDEMIIRELAREALEGAGFRVLEAKDGLEAVELFQADGTAVDLVLLDMTMPRMNGAEAFPKIRELAPKVRVLLTSGYTQKESLDTLVDFPPDGFLQKPFRVRELVAKAREILTRPGPN